MIGKDVAQAAKLLRAGAIVAIPTETVYGLAGNALNEKAVTAIFAAKNRPRFDPLIVHFAAFEQISPYVESIPEAAIALADRFMPGPLTLLLDKSDRIPDLVTAGSTRVAIRLPAHTMAQALLQALPFPLAAPSANPFGYISPTAAQHVADQLGDKIPYILDGGPCEVGLESTIVGFEAGRPVVYRKGGVPIEAITALIGPVEVKPHSTSNPQAPGMLKSHYAPGAPLILGEASALLPHYSGQRVGLIRFRETHPAIPEQQQLLLSASGDLAEAARRLFAGMRQLDGLALDVIIAELLPEKGLGVAINDRLRRAAAES